MKHLTAALVLGFVLLIKGFAGIEELEKRLEEIVIPEFKVESVTLAAAVDKLRALSKEHDKSGLHESVLGVRFAVERGRQPEVRLITLDIKGSKLGQLVDRVAEEAGKVARMGEHGVVFSAPFVERQPDDNPDELFLSTYRVAPAFLTLGFDGGGRDVDADPFAVADGSVFQRPRTLREHLQAAGITFPEGADAWPTGRTSAITVRNTATNHELIQFFMQRLFQDGNTDVRLRVELFRVPLATASAFARDRTRGRADADILAEIDRLCRDGDAKLVGTPELTTRSGQRAKIRDGGSTQLLVDYVVSEGQVLPAMEHILLGTELELDPILDIETMTIEVHLALSVTRGKLEVGKRKVVLPGIDKEAEIDIYDSLESRLSTSIVVMNGQTKYVGMIEGNGTDEESVLLAFVNAEAVFPQWEPPRPE